MFKKEALNMALQLWKRVDSRYVFGMVLKRAMALPRPNLK